MRAAGGQLPARYAESWAAPFLAYAAPALVPGARILDVGAGRRPTLSPDARPPDCRYVGLDIDDAELRSAPAGAYDEIVVADIAAAPPPGLDSFDLILSWQVLEHVPSLEATVGNLRGLLTPGGRLVFLVSGRYAAFALIARVVPHALRVRAMATLIGSDPDTKFPTYYDGCYATALERALTPFSHSEILPRYRGAGYFSFWRPLEATYLAYENWACHGSRRNLATHYVVLAIR